MAKQPFLTDFPLTVVATAKRRLQAAIRQHSAIIIQRSLSGYAVISEDVLPGYFLGSIDPTSHQRSFGHLPVFWVWLTQILKTNASCQKAVGLIQSWCRTSDLSVPSSDTSNYCKPRCRPSLPLLQTTDKGTVP